MAKCYGRSMSWNASDSNSYILLQSRQQNYSCALGVHFTHFYANAFPSNLVDIYNPYSSRFPVKDLT